MGRSGVARALKGRRVHPRVSLEINPGSRQVLENLARALVDLDPKLRGAMRKEGFMTRDPLMVERKKYGQKKARKRFQFSKR